MPVFRGAMVVAVASASVALLSAGCSSPPAVGESGVGLLTDILKEPNAVAVARLQPVGDGGLEGKVSFTQYGPIVVVRANFFGLAPGRSYGLHVHEKGDCRGADGAAAGGHFNPGGAPHGRPGRGPHHAGDLPNLQPDGEGNVFYSYETNAISITGGPVNVVGRSVVVSRNADDYRTQPDGNSGPPLACGLIRLN